MNQVARIFVVLNLLLAAGFLMAAATFLKQNEDWKKKHNDQGIAFASKEGEYKAAASTAQGRIEALTQDLNNAKTKISGLEQDKSDTATRLTAANESKATAEGNVEREQGTVRSLSATVEQLKGELASYNGVIEKAKTDTINAQKERDDAVRAKAEAVAALEAEKKNVHDRDNAITDHMARISKLEATLKTYTDAYPAPANTAQAKVDGTVVRFDPTTNVVQVNKGKKDNVQLGHRFDIIRGAQFICTVEVDSAGEDFAIGHVTNVRSPGREIQVGDTATTL